MGPFSLLTELIGVTSKISESSDSNDLARALNNTRSITERARKSLFIYPVLFSSGMADVELNFEISKFLELQYGIFTMMTVGLNPSVENGDISEYLKSIAAEDFSYDALKYKLKPVDPNQINSWYNIFSEENKDFFEEYTFATEANSPSQDAADAFNTLSGKIDKLNKKLDKKEQDEDLNDETDPFAISDAKGGGVSDFKLTENKIGKAAPTVFHLDIKIKGYQQTFKIPIALKAAPHFLRTEDLAALFDSAVEDKRLLTRIIRLTSGEISFFKDFMFNMDRIKRDQELYKRFGQHPWYQQFMMRKEKNKANRLGMIIGSLMGNLKAFTSSSPSNYLPTASIIMSVDELERSSKLKYGFLLKNDKILWSILNHLGLLCIGIYIPDIDSVTFYFNGFKKPLTMRRKDLKSDKNDPVLKMTEVMSMMMKRGIM